MSAPQPATVKAVKFVCTLCMRYAATAEAIEHTDACPNKEAPQPANTSEELQQSINKKLRIFQDYTASWGYPMNQDAHYKGLATAEKDIMQLIADHDAKLYAALEAALPNAGGRLADEAAGYNDCLDDARTALRKVFNMKEEADGEQR